MSKLKVNTREKILNKALEMFNERGIEYVGLRELAAVLNIRVSNITYYFPTKDDLVYEISLELRHKNSAIIVASDTITLLQFLQVMQQVFHNHYKFRCLLLSFVHVMEQNKLVASTYKKTQNTRYDTLKLNITKLASSGYLKLKNKDELDFLVSTLALISRFWISEAAISSKHLSIEAQIRHYLLLIIKLLRPYSTAKGRREMLAFESGL